MTLYKKQGGAWVPAQRVYVKHAGTWVPSDLVYVKRLGAWHITYAYDTTPPPAPQLTLSIIDTDEWVGGSKVYGRHINVGVRLPSDTADAGLALIRVLSTYAGAAPTTQYGGTYTSEPQNAWPEEAWSDFHYNHYQGVVASHQSNSVATKTWPPNASTAANLSAGTYHFAAWAMDDAGNWSAGTFATIDLPRRGIDTANLTVKEKRFPAVYTGTWSEGSFTYGPMIQSALPRGQGVLFYGTGLNEVITTGNGGVRKAQLRLERSNDTGQGQANVWLARHNAPTAAGFGEDAVWSDGHLVGTIGKGETKWFDLPSSWYEPLANGEIKGFVLLHKDPSKTHASPEDYSVMNSYVDSIRSGELHVIWTEEY